MTSTSPAIGDTVTVEERYRNGEWYRGKLLSAELTTSTTGEVVQVARLNGMVQVRVRVISGTLAALRDKGIYEYDYFWCLLSQIQRESTASS